MSYYKSLIIGVFSLLLLGFSALCAANTSASWILDPQHGLSQRSYKQLETHLMEAAKSSHIHVYVVLLNHQEKAMFVTQAFDKIKTWQAQDLEKNNQYPQTFLVINWATADVMIIVGNNVKKSTALMMDLNTIREKIILPSLQKNQIDQTIIEGALAIRATLEEWPNQVSSPINMSKILLWIFGLGLGAALIGFLIKFNRIPVWQTVDYTQIRHPDSIHFLDPNSLGAIINDDPRC